MFKIDLNNSCRICMEEKPKLLPINTINNEFETNFIELFNYCVSFEVSYKVSKQINL